MNQVDTLLKPPEAARQAVLSSGNQAPAVGAKRGVFDLSRSELIAWMASHGHPAYRADQARRWLFGRRAGGFDEMTDLPKELRAALADEFAFFTGRVVAESTARDGTRKLLVEWPDGGQVECVLMQEDRRRTACISTQVGCGMGCVFCASGLEGLRRNLTAGEIVEQLLRLDRLMPRDERLSHIVVMGMGEPLANLDALLKALQSIEDNGGLGISQRRITISTVGLPERMRQLAQAGNRYHLAVSLHAPDDELRNRIVPVNAKIGLAEILDAADDFFGRTGRQVTFEYVLLAGVNDSPDHGRRLGGLLAGRKAHVNAIPFNPVDGLPYATPSTQAVQRFADAVRAAGTGVTIRKRKGSDIAAACGQLRLHARLQ